MVLAVFFQLKREACLVKLSEKMFLNNLNNYMVYDIIVKNGIVL